MPPCGRQGGGNVVLAGGLGGRTDHSLGNIHCLWMLHDAGVDARIESGDERVAVVSSAYALGMHNGRTFSLLPLLPQTVVQRMTGVAYPLIRTTLPLGGTLGISNVVTSPEAALSMMSGAALLIIKEGVL